MEDQTGHKVTQIKLCGKELVMLAGMAHEQRYLKSVYKKYQHESTQFISELCTKALASPIKS